MPPSPKPEDTEPADVDHDAAPADVEPVEVVEAPAVADDGSEIHIDAAGTAWQKTEATVIERR